MVSSIELLIDTVVVIPGTLLFESNNYSSQDNISIPPVKVTWHRGFDCVMDVLGGGNE